MPDHRDIWFPAKTLGWGWGLPVAWQGWIVYGGAVALLIAAPFVLPPGKHPVLFHVYVLAVVLVLLVICWLKGERPRWRWGGSDDT